MEGPIADARRGRPIDLVSGRAYASRMFSYLFLRVWSLAN